MEVTQTNDIADTLIAIIIGVLNTIFDALGELWVAGWSVLLGITGIAFFLGLCLILWTLVEAIDKYW